MQNFTTNYVRTSWYSNIPLKNYDTSKIQFSVHAQLLSNIYSNLFELDHLGNFIPSLVDTYEWLDDETLSISIRKDIRTASSKKIDIEDVYLSLKRLVILEKNTHGRLNNIIAYSTKINHIDAPLEGIVNKGDHLIIKAKSSAAAKHLIPVLVGVDYGIIPKASIDWQVDGYPIIDYTETSGPYFAEEANDRIFLKRNFNHFKIDRNKNLDFELIPILGDNSPQLFSDDKIDLITSIDRGNLYELNKLIESESNSVHLSKPIKLLSLFFSKKGLSELKIEQRLKLGKDIKIAYFENGLASPLESPGFEFFSEGGEAGLYPEEKHTLNATIQSLDSVETFDSSRIVIAVVKSDLEKFKSGFKKFEQFSFVAFEGYSKTLCDAYLFYGDTGFLENISLISYYLFDTELNMTESEKNQWINDYIDIPEKSQRLNILRRLHFRILSEAYIVPIANLPYSTVAKKNFKINIPSFFASTPLWLITK